MILAMFGYLMVTLVCGGATCSSRQRSVLPEFKPPTIFSSGQPTLEELIQKTNRSLAVKSLASNSLTIDSPGIPSLSGNFRWERPDNFQLQTKLFSRALGTPLAAGSNANLFWLQTSRPTPTIFFARHDQFENQLGSRNVLPISPLWLREAFGVVELDPQGQHEGPTARVDGKLEVVSHIPTPRGTYRRVLTMAATTGTIEETRLYDHTGKLVAMASMSQHQYYSAIDWALPHKVQIQLLPDVGDPITFTVDIAFYQTNDQAPPNSFTFPDTTGLTQVDLVRINESMQREAYGYQSSAPGNTSPNDAGQNSQYNPSQQDPAQPWDSVPSVQQLPWQVQPETPPRSAELTPQSGSITNPIYRTATQPTSAQSWQDNLRR
jgi:hypothetical protein